ncbi:Fe-hydrogenase assembly protein [Acetoanaerobium sticklandii]|uniref:Fe-hydrogenase assembly protein n=1 Tax=Acetoanaerobium sticklandii (strain ATCC 12662 / DSM 519 / JCM 1433 / CCUG 9281 / NCIMB 10654 / HF) TaxID=499177 RepID=E3PX06_ACESD|nr:[FeFe] hydrogenase H-cluster radical SAM maturase HydG [Acetoanaerobium sticklandii]CBH20971.1 Fe-hydrogenase assembly protein [Acetoanaerobium sticklandii]
MINEQLIYETLEKNKNVPKEALLNIIDKGAKLQGLTYDEIAAILQNDDEEVTKALFKAAGEIKNKIYGNRVVMFAPLYISNYCVNSCKYCGYQACNQFDRKKLSQEEIIQEVKILEQMGHKRIALEAGEDPNNCPLDYVLEAIDTIYSVKTNDGNIRRINVNVAATTVENYKKLKDRDIGTYILFQETYHRPTYEVMHTDCLKGNYEYHLTAFDRAMEAGIDDVGAGVLFGLYDYKFEVLGLMMHNAHLEQKYGVGFHTISVPRLKKAEGMDLDMFPHILDDETFKRLIAVIRLAVPFTGMILSTRESVELRREAIHYGISQVSAGSSTGVGGYKEREDGRSVEQFDVSDHRSPLEVVKSLLAQGFVPSYCTACYRSGRTGDRFMQLAKSGNIHNVCSPNALMTLMEYVEDFGDSELKSSAKELIYKEAEKLENEKVKALLIKNLGLIETGERDLFL